MNGPAILTQAGRPLVATLSLGDNLVMASLPARKPATLREALERADAGERPEPRLALDL